ncbi:MAG: metal ABC transporter permease [Candidatus Altiarchaeota archaeon]|nr:metal ABC transporter permease [Candidatus Altiarchaeota archaeon]
MLELLQYDFMRNAVLAGLLASVACGIVGTYVVAKRIVFISGGISHAAFGGIGLAFFLGVNPILGALFFSLFSAVSLGVLTRKTRREDSSIGILWAVGMALGIVFINLSSGYVPDLTSYLFGNILTVPEYDIYIMAALDLLILSIVYMFYKEFFAVSFDEEYALATGMPVEKIYLLLLCLVAFTVVLLIQVVGIILVIALITLPAATACLFAEDIRKMMLVSTAFGVFYTSGGLYISYAASLEGINLPSGATIILFSAIVFFALSALRKRRSGSI